MIRAAALLIALAAPLPAFAQATPITATVDPARRALALELAKTLNPEGPVMAALEKAFGEPLAGMLLSMPEMKELEAEYPGIANATAEAMRPILLRYLRKSMPELWDRMAVIYSEMSEAELRAVIGFYRSPTGVRIVELMITESNIGPIIESAMNDPDGTTTGQDIANDTRRTANSAINKLTPAQIQETGRFAQTPAGRRIIALQPRINAVMADWSNNPSPEVQAEIETAMVAVVERFVGKPKK